MCGTCPATTARSRRGRCRCPASPTSRSISRSARSGAASCGRHCAAAPGWATSRACCARNRRAAARSTAPSSPPTLLGHGVDTVHANVLLTGGSQQGLDTVLRALTRPGDVLAVDALTYPGIKLLAAAHGLKLAPVPIRADGPDLDALDVLCRTRPVRAIYAAPTMHNPLGWVLGAGQRERIVAAARAGESLIVEDGTYAFLEPAPPPPLQALAPERTCYVAGLSKNVAAGLRFGFAVVPDAHVAAVVRQLRAAAWGAPTLVTS